jgi:hypothetical protein
MRLHFLTAGFSSANGRAMLFPLVCHRRSLADAGIALRFYGAPDGSLTDCDLLVLDCKWFGMRWVAEPDRVVDEIAALAAKTRVAYFDITDSTALEHPGALPFVHAYWKNQILADISGYGERHYGSRVFTDYYHRAAGVTDDPEVWSEAVTDPALRGKIHVAWNSALSDYSFSGLYRTELYRRFGLSVLLQAPTGFTSPESGRDVAVSARMTVSYRRASVAFQRRKLLSRLSDWVSPGRLSRRAFFGELRRSKVAISPFGWGEIAYRDFEAILSGALLVKPNMAHMQTWPNLYRDRETMLAFPWSLEGLEGLVDTILGDNVRRIAIAERAQNVYRRHLSGHEAAELFVARLKALVAAVGSSAGARPAIP